MLCSRCMMKFAVFGVGGVGEESSGGDEIEGMGNGVCRIRIMVAVQI